MLLASRWKVALKNNFCESASFNPTETNDNKYGTVKIVFSGTRMLVSNPFTLLSSMMQWRMGGDF